MLEKYLESARTSISRLPPPNIYHDIMLGVYKRTYHFSQNNIHPRIMPRFLSLFFSLIRRILCMREEKSPRTLSPQALLQKTVTSCNRTMSCCIVIVSRRETDTRPAYSLLDQRLSPCEREMCYEKWLKTIVHTYIGNILYVAHLCRLV